MRISDFRTMINSKRGPARPNLFQVVIYTKDRGSIEARELSAWCKATTLPGINLRTFDHAPKNYGLSQLIPFGINSEPLNCTFILDSDHSLLGFFHQWMQEIINYDFDNAFATTTDGKAPFELAYVDEYSTTMEIHFFSSDNSGDKYTMTLYDVYPTNVSSLNLAWDDNDSYATMPVQFSYSHFRVSGTVSGTGTAALDRMRSSLNGVYFENGRNMYSNDSRTSGSIQSFIDIETKIKQKLNSEANRLLKKIF